MKRIAILIATVLTLGSFSTTAYATGVTNQTTQTTQAAQTTEAAQSTQTIQTTEVAETTQTAEQVEASKELAGITPDNLLYIIDKAVDQLRVVLANTEEEKAEVNAEIAEERLSESQVMTEEGKVELALKALEEYNSKITEAAKLLQEVVVNLQAATVEDTDAAAEENTDGKLEQSIASLEKAIQAVQEKSLVVLDSLKNVTSEETANVVEEAIEEQINHKEAVANFVRERHEFNAAKKSLNMAKVALKKVEKHGSEDAVKDAQAKLTEAQKEYMIAQAELHAAFQIKKAADLGIEDKDVEVNSEEVVQASVEETDKVEENNQTAEGVEATKEATVVEATAKATEFVKTNNGNGNGNKSAKEEKEKKDKEKSAPGKSEEAQGKLGQGNGKNK